MNTTADLLPTVDANATVASSGSLTPVIGRLTQVERALMIEEARERVKDLKRLQVNGLINKTGDFFPSVHYPPITMYSPLTDEELFRGYVPPADGMFDVYAHIPFCKSHCVFCHYPVLLGPQIEEKNRYLKAFQKEMDIYKGRLGFDRIKARSILVGGGTPTYLTLEQLKTFLDSFTERLDLSSCRQFNYDVDPMTLIGEEGLERLRMMRDYGVDRLTIGVQSLNDRILKKMGRHHRSKEAVESINNALKFGYKVNIEFIFGYPGQTIDNWIDVMEEAVLLGVGEIQLYRLKVEAYGDYQGAIKNYVGIKPDELPTLEETIIMKQMAIAILSRHGYHENLRRVYSKTRGDYSVYAHNQCCVLFDQIGIGYTAFSSLRDRFALNTQDYEEYYRLIAAGRLPINRGIIRSHAEQQRWAIILPLKNRDVRKANYKRVTGDSLDKLFRVKIEKLKEHGLVREDEKTLTLTATGAFFADEVAQQFQHPDYAPYPPDHYESGPLNPYFDCVA